MTGAGDSRSLYQRRFMLVLAVGYAFVILAMISGFLKSLVLAAILCGIVYPLFVRLRSAFGGRATPASLLTLLVVILAIVVPMTVLLGLVAEQALDVAEQSKPWIESQLDDTSSSTAEWMWLQEKLGVPLEDIREKLAELAGALGTYLAGSLARLAEGTLAFFLQLFIMLYAMFFFLLSGPSLIRTMLSYFPLAEPDKERMIEVGLSVSRATIKGTLIIGAIQGALGGLGFAVAGIDAAVFWAAVMAVLSVLPGIGATLIWAPAVVYLLMSGQTVAGLGLLAWSAGVVSTIDNVLRPRLVGRDTELPDLLVLLSTLGGLALLGPSGLVIGPILAALFLAVLQMYNRVFADVLVHKGAIPDDQ